MFSRFLSLVLILTLLAGLSAQAGAPVVEANPGGHPAAADASQAMPGDLLRAFLDSTARPFTHTSTGYQAHLAGLEVTFGADGLHASAADLSWGLALTGLGRPGSLARPAPAEIAQAAERLEYRRGNLTEWYRHTPLGVEQGFTLRQAPPGEGPLTVQLAVTGGLAASADANGGGLSFTSPGGQALRYDHLFAWDAAGTPLEARMAYAAGQVSIIVDDRNAAYPITIDPLIYAEQKLIAGQAQAEADGFGYAVDVSGETAIVGAPYEDVDGHQRQGAAYVFVRQGNAWHQQARLVDEAGAAGDDFGRAVALSGDTAVVGATYAYSSQGAVYVFVRSGEAWSLRQELSGAGGTYAAEFGSAVDIYGNTILVGARLWYSGTNYYGAAYIFTYQDSTWEQTDHLTAYDGAAGDQFGFSVRLDGDTALVGAPYDDIGSNKDQGSVHVFTHDAGGQWEWQHKLVAPNGRASEQFGYSLALDGETALVGIAPAYITGVAYAFTGSGSTWSEPQVLVSEEGDTFNGFGSSLALDGDTALVGASRAKLDGDRGGAFYVFTRSGNAWSRQAKLVAADASLGSFFGAAVALDGDIALIGAVKGNGMMGAAYAFTGSGNAWAQQTRWIASDGTPNDHFAHAVAVDGDLALIGVPDEAVGPNTQQGSVYVFARKGRSWQQTGYLTDPDGTAGDNFGSSVALDGGTALVGAPDANRACVFACDLARGECQFEAALTVDGLLTGDKFAYSVDISGEIALVGAPYRDVGSNYYQGVVYAFTRSDTAWQAPVALSRTGGLAYEYFGRSLAVDGDTALIGADGVDDSRGAVYIVTHNGQGGWSTPALLAQGGAQEDRFGHAVDLNGNTALVGAHAADIGTTSDQGAAYAFTYADAAWSEPVTLTASDGVAYDNFGYDVAIAGDTALVGAYRADLADNTTQGAAYTFRRSANGWEEQKISASDGLADDKFGYAVALSTETLLVGAPSATVDSNDNQGAAYFYASLPTVQAITRLDPNPTDAASVRFVVTFSEAVTNVATTEFSLYSDGTLSGAAVTAVSGSGTAYTVTAATGAGVGALRLDVPAGAAIRDLTGNPLSSLPYTAGESYTVDQPLPVVTAITRLDPNPTGAASVRFAVAFSEAVNGVDAADFALHTAGALGGAAVSGVSGSGAVYTVTVSTGTGSGQLRLDVPATASIADEDGNPLSGLPYTAGQAYDIDRNAASYGVYLPLVTR
ncbi:MAG: hypothetical protein ACOYYS_08215 [Chloroflexota bacterium]